MALLGLYLANVRMTSITCSHCLLLISLDQDSVPVSSRGCPMSLSIPLGRGDPRIQSRISHYGCSAAARVIQTRSYRFA